MRILLTIQHPAHVHFFRNAYDELRTRGHDVRVCLREKSVAGDLLDHYGIEYRTLAKERDGALGVARMQATYEYRLLREAQSFEPDVIAAIGGLAAAHVASVVEARSVVFTDSEFATTSNRLTFPFADSVCTPDCYRDRIRTASHVTYPGFHELAYLHPDRFTPNPSVLDEVGIDEDDPYVVLRLIAWNAAHDAGEAGFDDVVDVVEKLEATGRQVLITAEGSSLPDAVADRAADVPVHRLHDLLAFADLVVGEGLTTAAESAVLGTPSVHVNTLSAGYLDELESHGLVHHFGGEQRHQKALSKATTLLERDVDWSRRRERLLTEKTDVTNVILARLLTASR